MSHTLFSHIKARWQRLVLLAITLIGLPIGCTTLERTERELVFRIEPGTASWYSGLPDAVEELDLTPSTFGKTQNIHAWWWPAAQADAATVLYLHGSRWNLTGQLFRIEQLHDMGFSVLAIDYRGFGKSLGELPSERSVNEDARIAWERLKQLQPDPQKRLLYGHSLGGAIAVDLAAEMGRAAKRNGTPQQMRGLIIESTFTNLADVAAAVTNTSLPVRWVLSQKFDSLDKIEHVGVPLLIVHGTEDPYVPSRFSRELYAAAREPKQLLLIDGGTHNNSMRLGFQLYAQSIDKLLQIHPHEDSTALSRL
ncbi:alpha/beta hydrolase [Azomonas macrocytogenes]|uniref:Serine aminopeptidase S33 domain-containing protein n=1 Tax=Azomonas macrocytogenes TaxID=69962 RepID=A0A839T2L1_AZOMA|nr:alpha/beta fold hydrolase [Azomonas macrocytogenes]MBB3102614.1 hypothetical protein [Azomonas macrocytogenes]